MKEFKKENLKLIGLIVRTIVVGLLLWISAACFIQHWQCDDMTQMQIFKSIPKLFLGDFRLCH